MSALVDSTIFRREGWSGDYQASCTLSTPNNGSIPWLRRGALWETYEAGCLVWAGFVDEVSRDSGTFEVSAYGRGARASEFPAVKYESGVTYTPSYIPDEAVDAAEARGMGFGRGGVNIGGVAVAQTPGEVTTVGALLDRIATGTFHWWVDSYGKVALRQAGGVKWVMRPGETYLGTADDNYASRLWGLYVSAVNGEGDPSEWSMTFAPSAAGVEAETIDKFGPAEQIVDLTALGRLFSSSSARADLDARYESVGGRMGWTNGINLTETNMHRVGTRVSAPLAVRAGDGLMLPGVIDDRSSTTYLPNVTVTLGEVRRIHDENRAEVKPVDFAPRGFSEALAAAQAPPSPVTAA
ncbi:hypothetical protein [Nocardioides sp. OK12]|uniref:hypothetical protein n=1 Tax=Nocardioides sp. OK12 TaxID=2758661 RepID=UPI0021C25B05|nr:hypothetical protein [Nocardioides sp. OK12]